MQIEFCFCSQPARRRRIKFQRLHPYKHFACTSHLSRYETTGILVSFNVRWASCSNIATHTNSRQTMDDGKTVTILYLIQKAKFIFFHFSYFIADCFLAERRKERKKLGMRRRLLITPNKHQQAHIRLIFAFHYFW